MQDYSAIGLNNKLQNVNSLAIKKEFINSVDFQSKFDSSSVSINQIDRNSAFKITDVTVAFEITMGSNTTTQLQVSHTLTKRRLVRPVTLLTDFYVTQRDNDHLFNATSPYGTALTEEEENVQLIGLLGAKENKDATNKIGAAWDVWNYGTASHDYFLDYRLVYIPLL